MEIKQIRPQENEYIKVLDSIALKPNLLYYYGQWPKERIRTVAIVGSRKNTKYGEEVAYKLAYELAKRGIIVVSGLAYGIDSIAARWALDGGGKTIAVLGTEIERIYPQTHIELAREIVKRGGVVASEYKLGDRLDRKVSFLHRNRLISGLADAVVVVEAAEKSGTLNTASHAVAQGRDLFAVPGRIYDKMSVGCNQLIMKGANPLTSIDDFMNFMFPKGKSRKQQREQVSLFGDTEEEKAVLELIFNGTRDGDMIMEKLDMPVQVFNQTITMLEIKGAVRPLGCNTWTLA